MRTRHTLWFGVSIRHTLLLMTISADSLHQAGWNLAHHCKPMVYPFTLNFRFTAVHCWTGACQISNTAILAKFVDSCTTPLPSPSCTNAHSPIRATFFACESWLQISPYNDVNMVPGVSSRFCSSWQDFKWRANSWALSVQNKMLSSNSARIW